MSKTWAAMRLAKRVRVFGSGPRSSRIEHRKAPQYHRDAEALAQYRAEACERQDLERLASGMLAMHGCAPDGRKIRR